MKRVEQREVAVKAIYMMHIHEWYDMNIVLPFFTSENLNLDGLELTQFILNQYLENRSDIEEKLNGLKDAYPLHRLSTIDKSILEVGVTEMFYCDTPSQIAINEAVEISKKYADEDSYRFINSALGTLERANNA